MVSDLLFAESDPVDESRETTALMPKPAFAGGALTADTPIREGVLEIPGPWVLHHRGELPGARIAWRLTGPAHAPLVCAIGGIWCDRRLFEPADPRRGC